MRRLFSILPLALLPVGFLAVMVAAPLWALADYGGGLDWEGVLSDAYLRGKIAWTAAQAAEFAREVEHSMRRSKHGEYFAEMYGNKPAAWSEDLRGADRLRLLVNVFTRMRALNADGSLDYDFKSTPSEMPPHLHAWFDAPNRRHLDHTIVFGHWSALGLLDSAEKKVLALDPGALWGGCLTAVNLADHSIVQEAAHGRLDW